MSMSKSNINDLIEQERLAILKQFLKNAVFERWSNNNLYKSAQNLGFERSYVSLLFPNKIKDLTLYFNHLLNAQMTETFLSNPELKGVSETIASLIEIKFNLYHPHREAIRCLLQYNLLPQNLCAAQKSLWRTCDQIWYLAGDKSTDYNYYSKRTLLAYVYSSSLLYWLSDESENYLDTKSFIRRKIKSVLKLGKWKAKGLNFIKNLFS